MGHNLRALLTRRENCRALQYACSRVFTCSILPEEVDGVRAKPIAPAASGFTAAAPGSSPAVGVLLCFACTLICIACTPLHALEHTLNSTFEHSPTQALCLTHSHTTLAGAPYLSHIHPHICAHRHAQTHTDTHRYTQTRKQTYTDSNHTDAHTQKHTYLLKHTCAVPSLCSPLPPGGGCDGPGPRAGRDHHVPGCEAGP